MIGDIKTIDGREYEVISETPITGYCQETEEDERARWKAGKPAPTYHYIAVSTRPIKKAGKPAF